MDYWTQGSKYVPNVIHGLNIYRLEKNQYIHIKSYKSCHVSHVMQPATTKPLGL